MILDSTPGRATYAATLRAFSIGLPKNQVLYSIGWICMQVAFVLFKLRSLVEGDMIELMRVKLNDRDVFPVETKRCYIYSAKDDMVQWQFVEQHAEEAKQLGYEVQTEKYLDSGHCGHLLADPKRYWQIVQTLWSSVA
jgi:hypothetical protein